MNIQQQLSLDTAPIYLMDGTAYIYRSFYSNRHLQRSDGFPTNALLIVTRTLLKILRQEKPEYFLFAMDGKGKNFRNDIYEKYKANREAMPEDLVLQIEPIKRMVQALGIRLEIAKDVEADDCIASLAARFHNSHPIVIVSGDKDLKQCLAPDVIMWDPNPKEEKLITMADFESENGISPSQWPDMQALMGDSSDNIPGVPGIGPKTARLIFKEYPSLEAIKDNISAMPAKFQDKLKDHLTDMFKWRELTTLRLNACENLSLEDLRLGKIDTAECEQLSSEYEMASIRREIDIMAKKRQERIVDKNTKQTEVPEKTEPDKSDADKIAEPASWPVAQEIENAEELPPCAEMSVGLVWLKGEKGPRLAIGQAEDITESTLAPVCKPLAEYLWLGKQADLCEWLKDASDIVLPDLKSLLVSSPSWKKLANSINKARFTDLGLASYLLNPDDGDYGWDRLVHRWRQDLQGENSGPATLALAMSIALKKNLLANQQLELYESMEMPMIWVLAEMQETGIAINPKAFHSFLEDVQKRLDELTDEVYKEAGEKFNIRSSRQLGEVLFEKLQLPGAKKTKSGQISTSQLVLEKLASKYPIVDSILELRKLEKMRSTYLDPLPRLMDANHRLHTTFNQEATATGRLSSSNPNLQNIPVRGPLGERMRACFVASPGSLLISADYSQIELRILAHLSGDKSLLEAFHNDKDIHTATAALIFDLDSEAISADQRRMAKTINFGLLYGMGPQKLAQELKISLQEAKDFIERYFSRLGQLKIFYEQILEGARKHGYVTTMAGRRRWLPGIYSTNGQLVAQAQRQAINAVIQGSAADVIKIAMLAVYKDSRLREMQASLILQIHDELLLEAPEDKAGEAASIMVSLMENVHPGGQSFSIPLLVDSGYGANWAEAH